MSDSFVSARSRPGIEEEPSLASSPISISPEDVYRDFATPVSRLCRRMFGNRADAEDAAQEAWAEIVRSLPSFEGRSKVSTWVWTIARRAAFRHLKREKTYSARFLRELFSLHERDGIDEFDRVPAEDRTTWVKTQCSECLTAILHCVPSEDRFLYLLRRLVGLPYAEIAEAFGLSEATARQRCARSMRKIDRFLSGQCVLYNPTGACRCKLREPIRRIDESGEFLRLRELSKKALFLDDMDSWYPPAPDYWKELVAREREARKGAERAPTRARLP